jgi:hypothetical protein
MWGKYLELYAGAASAFSENGNRVWIASKIGDVIFHPPEQITISIIPQMKILELKNEIRI